MQECELILFRQFNGFMVLFISFLYLLLLGRIVCWITGSVQRTSLHAYQNVWSSVRSNHNNGQVIEERIIIRRSNSLKRSNSLRRTPSLEAAGVGTFEEVKVRASGEENKCSD